MNIVAEETYLEVVEEVDELVILEEVTTLEAIEIGNIILTETDLIIHNLPVKSEIHPDDLMLLEDAEDTYARKQIKASRLTDGGQFT
jgi:hypothetical protein